MKNNLRQVYNEVGKHYTKPRLLWPEVKEWLEEVSKHDLVLDVGCGEGRLLQELGSKADYTGIDFSPKLIDMAKRRYKGRKTRFITGDVCQKETWNDLKKYDKIFLVAMLHHLPTRKLQLYVLKKVRQHMKTGGKVFVSCWDLFRKKFLGEHLRNLRLKLSHLPESIRWVEIPFGGTKIKRFYVAGGEKYWKDLCLEAGWEQEKIQLKRTKKNILMVLG